jgi:hypothetical protein
MPDTLTEKKKSYSLWPAMLAVTAALGTGFGIAALLWKPVVVPEYSAVAFSGEVESYAPEEGTWLRLSPGDLIQSGRKIRTGRAGRVDLIVPEQIHLRLQENSLLEIQAPRVFERGADFRVQLERGTLLAATQKGYAGERFEVLTPVLRAKAGKGALFRVSLPSGPPPPVAPSVTVLRGTVQVKPKALDLRPWISVKNLEKSVVDLRGRIGKPYQMSRQDWREVNEAYELGKKGAGFERIQLDLAKEAGTLFQYVFDHGTFYTPELGYALREFNPDQRSNEMRLQIEYDVFPTGSFVGMYMKTRNLNLADFSGLEFEVRSLPDQGVPSSFKIEMKSKFSIERAFKANDFTRQWRKVRFNWRAAKEIPITEVTLVFSWDRAGNDKKGFLEFRNFNLIPAEKAS